MFTECLMKIIHKNFILIGNNFIRIQKPMDVFISDFRSLRAYPKLKEFIINIWILTWVYPQETTFTEIFLKRLP